MGGAHAELSEALALDTLQNDVRVWGGGGGVRGAHAELRR